MSPSSPVTTDTPETRLPVLIVRPHGKGFDTVLRKFSADARLVTTDCSSGGEAATKVRQLDWCFLLSYVADAETLSKLGTMLKVLSGGLKKKRVRLVVVLSADSDRSLEGHLKYYGVTEVIFEPVAERALLFKLERHVRAQHQQMTRARLVEASDSEDSERPEGRHARAADSNEEELSPTGPRVIWGQPLALRSDFWLTSKVEAKIVMDRWLIRLLGPSATFGRWTRVKDSGDPGVWQWVPLYGDNDPFLKEPGAWYFRGIRPELQGESWQFTGPKPELLFGADGKLVGRKLHVDGDRNLLLARDSKAAFDMVSDIRESFRAGAQGLSEKRKNRNRGGKPRKRLSSA